MSAPATFALLLVSYGSGDEIAACLRSVFAGTVQPERILVADNLVDGCLSGELAAFADRVEIVDCPDNPGYGGAINRLVVRFTESKPTWLLVANPDVTFEPDAIERMLSSAASARYGAVGPKVLDENGHVYPSARQVPSIRTGIGHALFGKLWPSNPWTRSYFNNQQSTEARDAGWLSGACVAIRSSAFADVGGFDDGYFMYFEDVDLGYRLGQRGWRNRYEPSAIVHHSGGHSTKDKSALMRKVHHDSAALFLRRRYPGPLGAIVRFPLGVGLWLRERFGR